MKKRYDAEIEQFCKFCVHGSALSDPDRMLCKKLGIVNAGNTCRRFQYDPLKREPTPALSVSAKYRVDPEEMPLIGL